MRPFLGQVPIRTSRPRSLGQVEFTDPWGGQHKVTIEPTPLPPNWKPFNAPFSEESIARDEREEMYLRKIAAKKQECEFLQRNIDDHKKNLEDRKRNYFDREEAGEAEYQSYANAVKAYNDAADAYDECFNKVDALEAEMNTAPVDFGTTDSGYQWPPEVPEPTGRPFNPGETPYVHEPEPPPVPSVDWSWPPEVPKPPEVVPEPPPPEIVEQPPATASVDWRTDGCPPGTQRIIRGGMCVSSGLVSSALTTPTTVPFTMSGRIPLLPGLGVRALGRSF